VITALPTTQGTPQVGLGIFAGFGTWQPAYTVVSWTWQWQADRTPIAGADDYVFVVTPAEVGKRIRACKVLSAQGYVTTSMCSAELAPVPGLTIRPAPAPQISGGTPTVGEPLLCAPGTWMSNVTLECAWYVGGQPGPVATGTTFTPSADHLGKTVQLKVTGVRAGYTTVTTASAITAPVRPPLVPGAPVPIISGTPKVGLPLTAQPGVWPGGITPTYQWLAGGAAITGATGTTFVPTAAQAGRTISVRATGVGDGFSPTPRTSLPTVAVAKGTLVGAVPRIGGTVRVGRTLTAKPGTWTAGTRFAYRWYANGTAIPRATTSRLSLIRTLKGKRITVKVTGTRTGYTTLSRTSTKTGRVAG
jgi:hypothetical protein